MDAFKGEWGEWEDKAHRIADNIYRIRDDVYGREE
jgi:hypothetical protein